MGDKKLRFPMNWKAHNTSIKRCMPFLDAMTAGYTFVLHDDVYVEQIDDEPFIRWKSDVEMITWHSSEQFEGLHMPDYCHNMVAKWQNDYEILSPPGYSLWFTHPVNRFDLPFITLSGFVDTDKYATPVQFPFFLKKGFEGIIESGTPIAQMFPVKREPWKLEIEKHDPDKTYLRFRKFWRTFAGSYKSNFWTKKEYL